MPEFVRGRQLVVIDGAVLAADDARPRILAPLRELGPEMDTFARVPAAGADPAAHGPRGPDPGMSAAPMLAALPEAVDAFLAGRGRVERRC